MSTIPEIREAICSALEPLRSDIPDLQLYPYHLDSATPPTIDVYQGDPFMDWTGFGMKGAEMYFTVRARATTGDSEAGQKLLDQMYEPETGIAASLATDQSLGGVVSSLGFGDEGNSGISGLREYVEDTAVNGKLLGFEVRVRVIA